jgi:hypothetical protein
MAVMAIVWPACALFGTIFVLLFYYRHGRETGESRRASKQKRPFSLAVAKGTLHCGGGCTLGDIVAEWLAFSIPAIATVFGWHSVFDDRVFAIWILDFILAFAFGLLFQYLAIAPMRHLSTGEGIIAALKADTLSLLAWQIGMYCTMAYLQFDVFTGHFGGRAPVDSVEFWGAMQLAMIAGFITSYPMNWWLIQMGVKEKM